MLSVLRRSASFLRRDRRDAEFDEEIRAERPVPRGSGTVVEAGPGVSLDSHRRVYAEPGRLNA